MDVNSDPVLRYKLGSYSQKLILARSSFQFPVRNAAIESCRLLENDELLYAQLEAFCTFRWGKLNQRLKMILFAKNRKLISK